MFLTLMGACLIVRNGIIYTVNFKNSRELIVEIEKIMTFITTKKS